ncbi:MAG TPA: glycosyltransferase family 2 protein [Phycisphaerae bacterium]|nr:glycosyltransferase family 2 protein [Phycisphaerae bacterium]HPS52516.1 glycosyltransferase family 2 protein [Phycisphaerae bacterium]
METSKKITYSIVVPFYNEQDIIEKLHDRLVKVMDSVGGEYELVYVNDGSRDDTPAILEKIATANPRVVFVDLRRNFGQTTGLMAGFDVAGGEIIISMDGDLQHDPYEIPMFIEKIREGYDIASGWRIRRGDNFVMRRLPSKIANRLLAAVSGVALHDFGTTFKAYRREVLEDVRLYGDMHRFVPAVCQRLGARICEVPIKNVRRAAGKSNYGIGRTFRVALDIITLKFITGYLTRPMHFFGRWGMASFAFGLLILFYGFLRKIFAWNEFRLFEEHGPLMALGFLLLIVGMFFLSTGLIGEMLMRIYFESTNARTYAVKRIFRNARQEK